MAISDGHVPHPLQHALTGPPGFGRLKSRIPAALFCRWPWFVLTRLPLDLERTPYSLGAGSLRQECTPVCQGRLVKTLSKYLVHPDRPTEAGEQGDLLEGKVGCGKQVSCPVDSQPH